MFQYQFEKFEKVFNNINNYVLNSSDENEFNQKKDKILKYGEIFKTGIYNSKLGLNSTAFVEKSHFNNKNYWLIKAIDLNRGRCIKISNKCEEIKQIIQTFSEGISRGINESEESEEENNNKKLKNNLSPIKEKTIKNKSGEILIKKDDMNMRKSYNSPAQNKTTQIFNLKSNKKFESNSKENNKENEAIIEYEMENELNNEIDLENNENNDKDKEGNNEDNASPDTAKKKKKRLKKYKANCVLVQKYIERPLLYWGRKFDIRMWIMIDHKNNVYLFK